MSPPTGQGTPSQHGRQSPARRTDRRCGARFVFVSTDLVFDGDRGNYRETDPPNPLTVYGRTKADAEKEVLAFPGTAVARLSLLYGPCLTGRSSFFDRMVTALRENLPISLFADEWRTPLALPTAAAALASLARSDVTGLRHIGGPERPSRLEMGRQLAEVLGVSGESIVVTGRNDVPADEPRPADTSLDSSRWRGLFPSLPWPTHRAVGGERRPYDRRSPILKLGVAHFRRTIYLMPIILPRHGRFPLRIARLALVTLILLTLPALAQQPPAAQGARRGWTGRSRRSFARPARRCRLSITPSTPMITFRRSLATPLPASICRPRQRPIPLPRPCRRSSWKCVLKSLEIPLGSVPDYAIGDAVIFSVPGLGKNPPIPPR